jgi:hypothetical protein
MKIQVIKVEVEENAKYKMATVTYKNLTFNKTESRKIPSFKNPDVFTALSKAVDGDTFEVETVKDGQYIQWTKVTKSDGSTPASGPAAAATSGTPYKSTYETADERAKRQVYIVRQSSVSNAIAALSVGAKAKLDTEEVLGLARQIEAYVFGNDPMQQLLDMPNDLPDVTV